MDQETLKAIREMLKEELEPIKSDIKELKSDMKELKTGQEEIKVMVGELDPKNANRHLELQESISQLRKEVSTVEIVTASNYSDIAKLKNVK